MSRRRRRTLWKSLEPSPEVHSPRTISEIANWMDSSNEEKAAIVRAANGRRDGAG